MKFGTKLDEGDLRRLLSKMDGIEEVARGYATANALTKAGSNVRNESIDKVKAEFPALRPSRIRKHITLRRATPTRLEAEIDIERKTTNVVEFTARQTKLGVTAAFRGGRRALFPHAFIVPARGSKKPLVFVRAGGDRLPIRAIPGPSVGGILRKYLDELLAHASQEIRADIERRIAKILGK